MNKKKFVTLETVPYRTDFKEGLFWNLFDSVGTQGLLILFHLFFRQFFGATLHGIMGCTLSLLYLAVIISNFGLDASFAPFFETYTRSKRSFRAFIWGLLIPQLILLSTLSTLFYVKFPTLSPLLRILTTLAPHLTSQILIVVCATFIFESMRKTMRYFLKLAFYTQFTAWIEVAAMATYLGFLVYSYGYDSSFGIFDSWRALLILSAAQLTLLVGGIYHFYRSLPASHDDRHTLTFDLVKRILSTRLFTWGNQSMHQLFSGNFLVPVCAIKFGIEQASLMKVFTSVSAWITLIAQKVFGITGNALLAHLKSQSLEMQKAAFNYLTMLLNQALVLMLIFLLINGKKLALLESGAASSSSAGVISWSLLYFMLLLSFFESLFIIYEKWYILEEQAWLYFLINAVSFGVLYSIISFLQSAPATLIAVILVRVCTFALLTIFSFYRWKIWPTFKLHWPSLIGSIIISVVFHALL